MSTTENVIYEYLIRAKEDFQAKKHPVDIGGNAGPSLWLLSENISPHIKAGIEFLTLYQIGISSHYEILLGKDNNDQECFYCIIDLIQEGGFGQVKQIKGYFHLNHEAREAEWKETVLVVKCLQLSKRSPLEAIQNEWNHLFTYSNAAKVSPEVRPLFYSYRNKDEIESQDEIKSQDEIESQYEIFAFMVMNYLGKDLQTWIEDQYPDFDPFSLAIKVLTLIQSLHKMDIVHRDLKLTNFTITEEEELCVIDFGMAGDFSNDKNPKKVQGTSVYKDPHYLNYARVTDKYLPLSTTEDVGSVFFLLQEIMNITFYPFSYEENEPVYRKKTKLFKLTREKNIPANISSQCIMETLLLFYDIGEKYIPLEEIIFRLTIIKESPREFLLSGYPFSVYTGMEKSFILKLGNDLLKAQTKNDFAKVVIDFLKYLNTLKLKVIPHHEAIKRADIIVGFLISTEKFPLFKDYAGYLYYRHIRAHILAEKYLLQPSQQNLQELFRYPVLKNVYLREKISKVSPYHQGHIAFLIKLDKSLDQKVVNQYYEAQNLLIHIKNIMSKGSLIRAYNSLSLLENLFHNYMANHPHGELSQTEGMPTLASVQQELRSQANTYPTLYGIFRYIISLSMQYIEILKKNSDQKLEAPPIADLKKFETLSKEQQQGLSDSIKELFEQIIPSAANHQSSTASSSSSYSIQELQQQGFHGDRKGKGKEPVKSTQHDESKEMSITRRLRRFFS